MSLQGQIEEMGLGAVIQTLSLNQYQGTLRIETEDAGSQFFFISQGEIVLVRQVKRKPIRVGELLVRAGKLTEEQIDEALAQQKSGGKRLGDTLVELGLVTHDEIESVIRGTFEEEFLDLFLLDKGRFEFIFGLTPEALFAPDEQLERITLSTSGVILEAMRRLDEWQDMINGLGSLDSIHRNRAASLGADVTSYRFEGVTLPAQARRDLYELLDGTRSLREVISVALRQNIASRMETFQFLHHLTQNELVKPLEFRTLLAEARRGLTEGDVPSAAKYIRAILVSKERLDLALVKRYLEFLRKHQRPRLSFDEARRFAAQRLAEGDSQQAIALFEEALKLDRNPEVIDRLFYALLRENKRERALQVGLMLREFLSSEENLAVAMRVNKNLRELDPDNPEVIEFTGLVHKRQEQNEDAIAALEQALSGLPDDHPRRRTVIAALLELQPERTDLRDAQESLDLQHAQAQLRREVRRRWVFVGGALFLLITTWRVYGEVRARSALSEAEQLMQVELTNSVEFRRVASLLQDSLGYGFTTVSGRARTLKERVDADWSALEQRDRAERDRAIAERKKIEDERREREALAARRKQIEDALAAYQGLVGQRAFEAASEKAIQIQAEFARDTDSTVVAQVGTLKVYTLVNTTPSGADVFLGATHVGKSPVAVPVPLGGAAPIRLRHPGYRVLEVELAGAAYASRDLQLEPGPTWRVDLGEEPLAPVVWSGGVVLAGASGRTVCYTYLDGAPRWSLELLGGAASRVPLAGIAAADRHLVGVRGSTIAAVELETGQVEWQRTLPGGEQLLAPVAAQVFTQNVFLVAGERVLHVVDASSGTVIFSQRLPAKVIHPPAAGADKAFVALADRVVAIDLKATGNTRALLWEKAVVATAAPFWSATSEALVVPEGRRYEALGGKDGAVVSVLAPSVGAVRGMALVNERLCFLGETGLLSILRTYDGQELLPGRRVVRSVSGGPAVLQQDLVIVDAAGLLTRLTLSGRKRGGEINLGGPVTAPLVTYEGRVIAVQGSKMALVEPVEGD